MKLIPLPAFSDNYIWMLHDGQGALVVDPGEAQPVFHALQTEGVQLQAILVTHHHADHTAGVDILRNATGATVYGPGSEAIPAPLVRLSGGDVVLSLGLTYEVIDVPGHTAGHIAFYCRRVDAHPLLFCGDTLFSAGCGRLFEGTSAQMLSSLSRLASLPADTRVCCTHEYTLSNLKFAREVEPDNQEIITYEHHCRQLRAAQKPTLPSTIAQERAINPFLRSAQPAVAASAKRHDALAVEREGVFATLREWKNNYR
jgi:hydroxyacylglutathione hydrolase